MYILWCKTNICSCKLSSKVSLMLDNPFPVSSLCKLNHISVYFIQISTKTTRKQLISSRESNVFWSDPQFFGLLGKFQYNMEISIKTARVFGLSFHFLWLLYDTVYLFNGNFLAAHTGKKWNSFVLKLDQGWYLY